METTVECADFLDKIVIDLLGERKNIKEYAKQINQNEVPYRIKERGSCLSKRKKIKPPISKTAPNTAKMPPGTKNSR